jgi:hypothetical protein
LKGVLRRRECPEKAVGISSIFFKTENTLRHANVGCLVFALYEKETSGQKRLHKEIKTELSR